VALTANAMTGIKEMFLESGFNDFISKPINEKELDLLLKKWIPDIRSRRSSDKKLAILTDDNPDYLLAGKAMLSEQFMAATCPSAEKLLTMLEKNIPVVIFLDIDMPKMDGLQALKILKSKEETKNIPVVLLAEKDNLPDMEEVISLGAADCVGKPLKEEEIKACIKKVLGE
jgi:CheY-like chemotaxis protein